MPQTDEAPPDKVGELGARLQSLGRANPPEPMQKMVVAGGIGLVVLGGLMILFWHPAPGLVLIMVGLGSIGYGLFAP